jgi:hypothetical protein
VAKDVQRVDGLGRMAKNSGNSAAHVPDRGEGHTGRKGTHVDGMARMTKIPLETRGVERPPGHSKKKG